MRAVLKVLALTGLCFAGLLMVLIGRASAAVPSPAPAVTSGAVAPHLAPGLLAGYATSDWSFAGDSFRSRTDQPIQWTEATLTVPTSVALPAVGDTADGWVMGYLAGAQTNYTQIGWKMTAGIDGGAPHLFTESDGQVDPDTYPGLPLNPGASYIVAVSCDQGTTTWHDWLLYDGGLRLIASPSIGITCAEGTTAAVDETFAEGAPLAPVGGISVTWAAIGGAQVWLP